jgi:hypothetical protein
MEMPAQGGHDKSGMKRSGHTVSHKCLVLTRHGGESETTMDVPYYTRVERTSEGPPRQGDPGDPLCCGGCALTHPCVCVLSRGRVRKPRTYLVEFRYCNVGLIVIHD